jgi:hypothetical protein
MINDKINRLLLMKEELYEGFFLMRSELTELDENLSKLENSPFIKEKLAELKELNEVIK